MSRGTQLLILVVCLAGLVPAVAKAKSSIRITGSKDLVITVDSREQVLNAGERYLDRGEPDFLAMVGELENPFSFEQAPELPLPTELVETRGSAVPVPAAPPKVVYDDASILAAISGSLGRQVRGTIARGDTRYMQLEGGGLLKAGSTLPARLPQLEGQTFEVTIAEVTADGYTLRLNEESLYVPFSETPRNNSGALIRSAP